MSYQQRDRTDVGPLLSRRRHGGLERPRGRDGCDGGAPAEGRAAASGRRRRQRGRAAIARGFHQLGHAKQCAPRRVFGDERARSAGTHGEGDPDHALHCRWATCTRCTAGAPRSGSRLTCASEPPSARRRSSSCWCTRRASTEARSPGLRRPQRRIAFVCLFVIAAPAPGGRRSFALSNAERISKGAGR